MNAEKSYTFTLPPSISPPKKKVTVMAVDVGGTKSNFALCKISGNTIVVLEEETYHSAKYQSFTEIIQEFQQKSAKPDIISIGIAGPVLLGKAKATNLPWSIDTKALGAEIELEQVYLLNDLEANAYGLAVLPKGDLKTLHPGEVEVLGNAALISPGTGLGEAGLYWDGERHRPFATEGGHTDFGARTDLDVRLYYHLRDEFGHVSWERVISGPGIMNIYQFLRDVEKREEPIWLKEILESENSPAVISRNAHEDCPICLETMQLFLSYLAREAANLTLKIKAVGGLYIGGGIVPKNLSLVNEENFLNHFFRKGRLSSLLRASPVHIVLNPKTALLGAAYYGGYIINGA